MYKKIFYSVLGGVFVTSAVLAVLSFVEKNDVEARGSARVCRGRVMGMTEETNPNAGITYFDYNVPVDLSIVGKGRGYAPAKEAYDSCLHRYDSAQTAEGVSYELGLRGWAWNDNIGFISFHCKDGKNRAHEIGTETVDCGPYNYGVYIDNAGNLFGYAWSPTFGWVRFPKPGEWEWGGVTRNSATGEVSGYVWTQAGVWMKMTGMRILIGGEEEVECGDQGICFEIFPDPFSGAFDIAKRGDLVVADGNQSYQIRLSLKDKDGKLLEPDDEWTLEKDKGYVDLNSFINGVELTWNNNLRLNSREPWSVVNNAVAGGLPLRFDFSKYDHDDKFWYLEVKSYAPTTRGNVSFLSSTKAPFYNESFIFMPDADEEVFSPVDDTGGRNRLSLTNVKHGELKYNHHEHSEVLVRENTQAWVNGDVTVDFEFRPAIEVENLYKMGAQPDALDFGRVVRQDILSKVIRSGDRNFSSDEKVSMYFYYEYEEGIEGGGFELVEVDGEDGSYDKYVKIDLNLGGEEQSFFIMPVVDEDGGFVLDGAKLGLYTEVEYKVDDKTVRYYSNKLPRIPGGIENPQIVVHGAIQARLDMVIDREGIVDTSGQVNMRTGRETLIRNLVPYRGEGSGTCVITGLSPLTFQHGTCSDNRRSKVLRTGEDILYFKGDVIIKLNGDTMPDDNLVIVSEGGSIFIDSNIYDSPEALPKVALVALRTRSGGVKSGHIYIHPDVTDIQGILIADGAVFSYSGDRGGGIEESGEPSWVSSVERADVLRNQLVIKGAVSSGLNTLGGADRYFDPKQEGRVLVGGRRPVEASPENILTAQGYDLNYLRMFKLGFELGERGCPIDTRCQVEMCTEELVKIARGETIEHEDGTECDGLTTEDLRPVIGKQSEGRLVKEDYLPVYIYQATMKGPSVIFTR